MNEIYITSDLHFGHSRNFVYEPRGFKTIWEHDKKIIENWNSVVDMTDDVYLLGDVMLGDNNYGLSCLKQLNGRIHIIRGNHDTDARLALYKNCYNVVEVCDAKYLKAENQMFFLSHYPSLTANWDTDKPLKSRIINLCGHVHTKDRWNDWDKGLIYHCEVDAHECKPINIKNIIEDIKEQFKAWSNED